MEVGDVEMVVVVGMESRVNRLGVRVNEVSRERL